MHIFYTYHWYPNAVL